MHAQPAAPEIRAVRLTGVTVLPTEIVATALTLQPTRCRSPLFWLACAVGIEGALERRYLHDLAAVELDAERITQLYAYWGYPRAQATGRAVPRGDAVIIEYAVVEGPPLLVEGVSIQGLAAAAPPPIALPSPLPLRAGAPYAVPRLAATEEILRDSLAERGHAQPRIDAGGDIDEAGLRARVVLTVVPGPVSVFAEPELQVAAPLDEGFLRPRLAVQPGAPYRLTTLERMEAELYTLPIVEQVITGTRALPGDTVVYPTVRVQTRRRAGYEVGGTLSSARCLEVGGAVRDRHALGGPRMATASLSFSNLLAGEAGGRFPCAAPAEGALARPDYRAQLELLQPWLGSPRTALLLRGFARRETAPLVYVQRGFGGEVMVSHELQPLPSGVRMELGYAPRRDELDAVALYFCANYALCEPGQVDEFARPRWLAPAQFRFSATTPGYMRILRPPPLAGLDWLPLPAPRLRHRLALSLDAAAPVTGSDYTWTRGRVDGALTRSVGRDVELAGRVAFGIIAGDAVLPPQVRMYSGGVVSVRGVPQNLLGPVTAVIPPEQVPAGCAPPCDVGQLPRDGRNLRPAGGDRLVEAAAEARFWVADALQLVGFVDYGRLSRTEPVGGAAFAGDVGTAFDAALTPGAGVRILSPMGPIRIDVARDGRSPRRYPVYTQAADGSVRFVGTGTYDPWTWDAPGGFREFVRRLQLQLAVGHAF